MSDDLVRLAARAGDLPALPDVAMRVAAIASDPDGSMRDLEAAVARDQAIAARVLRLSNSAYYGLPGHVSTLGRAILVIGAAKLKAVVLAACTESLFHRRHSNFPGRVLWEHSLATALVARHIATLCGYPDREEALVAGLLHDIGKVVMDTNDTEKYRDVILRVTGRRETFVTAEREIFGFDHAQVGGLVTRRWSLAESLSEAVRCHHDPETSGGHQAIAAIVSLANSVCVKLEIGPERRADLELATLRSGQLLGLDHETLDALPDTGRACIEAERQALADV